MLWYIGSPYDTYFWKSGIKQITLIAKITKYIQPNTNYLAEYFNDLTITFSSTHIYIKNEHVRLTLSMI